MLINTYASFCTFSLFIIYVRHNCVGCAGVAERNRAHLHSRENQKMGIELISWAQHSCPGQQLNCALITSPYGVRNHSQSLQRLLRFESNSNLIAMTEMVQRKKRERDWYKKGSHLSPGVQSVGTNSRIQRQRLPQNTHLSPSGQELVRKCSLTNSPVASQPKVEAVTLSMLPC